MLTWFQYITSYVYKNQVPNCLCGCGKQTKLCGTNEKFNSYVQGHNKTKLSNNAKIQIGLKNSQNLKAYYKNNPIIAQTKAKHMRSFLTKDNIEKRSLAIKESYKDPKLLKKLSEISKKRWQNKDLLKTRNIKTSQTWHKRDQAGLYESYKEKMSLMMTNKLLQGKKHWKLGTYQSHKMNKSFNFKSSWEENIMKQLDSSTQVVSWSYETISIKYYDENHKIRRYIPDFIITLEPGHKILLEVKAPKLALGERQQCKFTAAKQYCIENNIEFVLCKHNTNFTIIFIIPSLIDH